jgi:hypothetical protein
MKFLIATLMLTSFAQAQAIKPCTTADLTFLKQSIVEWNGKGFTSVKLIKNQQNQTLGFYSSDKAGTEMYSEICESLGDESNTVANQWYYWDSTTFKTNPADWKLNGNYSLSQDEGQVSIRMIKPSLIGNVTVELEITGTEEGQVVRKDIVNFVNP